MQAWHKYLVVPREEKVLLTKDVEASDHQKTMEGFRIDAQVDTKDKFFERYYWGGFRQFQFYDRYFRERLEKQKKGLSVGSGRCVNELLLAEDGYNIICSDLALYCPQLHKIFPGFQFSILDILRSSYKEEKDFVMVLCIIYLFDESELLKAFQNLAKSLKNGGSLFIDASSANDNVFSWILDNVLCPVDAQLQYLLKKILKRQDNKVIRKHHGYRYSNKEVIKVAEKAGLVFVDVRYSDYVTELKDRLLLFSRLPDWLVVPFSLGLPHIRMFQFIKK
jgi:SAM-dependent methyltransferase